jgi:DNA-directed RNA polymerase specialized sigma24 family protein
VPTKQLSMRKTREILRLKWVLGRSHREITNTLAVGLGTITQVVMRAERAKITNWSEVEALSDDALDSKMYPAPV